MTRSCELTGKIVMSGNNVSHANNKSKRRFIPNIQKTSLFSEELGKSLKFKVAVSSIRSVEKNGGIDNFLIKARDKNLSITAKRYKKEIIKKRNTNEESS